MTQEQAALAVERERAIFDPAPIAELADAVDNCRGYNGRLAELAEYEADFYQHSGHDRETIKASFYQEAHDQIATLFPDDYPFPGVAFFAEYHDDLTELVSQGLRNICSIENGVVRAVVARDDTSLTTIEAALNEDRCGIFEETPVHVFRTDADGTRRELTVIVPERGPDYQGVASLLDMGAEAMAEQEDAKHGADKLRSSP
jgi:hypothetical protein